MPSSLSPISSPFVAHRFLALLFSRFLHNRALTASFFVPLLLAAVEKFCCGLIGRIREFDVEIPLNYSVGTTESYNILVMLRKVG